LLAHCRLDDRRRSTKYQRRLDDPKLSRHALDLSDPSLCLFLAVLLHRPPRPFFSQLELAAAHTVTIRYEARIGRGQEED
jgi:hypothetical protein